MRKYIERNSVALLSSAVKMSIDVPSRQWLGCYCWNAAIRTSGLWNVDHVNDSYDPDFLELFEQLIKNM